MIDDCLQKNQFVIQYTVVDRGQKFDKKIKLYLVFGDLKGN